MRKLVTVIAVFALSGLSLAQSPAASAPPQGSNWQHVQILPLGVSIHVKGKHNSVTCRLKSVDADSLTCTQGKDIAFQRTEIKSIAITRRGRSALIGLAIGGGVGAAVGFGLGSSGNGNSFLGPNFERGPLTAGFAGALGLIGSLVGAGTDFAHSTVYKAP